MHHVRPIVFLSSFIRSLTIATLKRRTCSPTCLFYHRVSVSISSSTRLHGDVSSPLPTRWHYDSMVNFSIAVASGATVAYLLDTHGADALHILSLTTVAKDMVLYGSTFFANGFILSRGVKVSLLIIGACQAVCWLSSIPMYVYGKRVRSFVSPSNSFRSFPLRRT